MRRLILLVLFVSLALGGCAHFGVWSDPAKAKLEAFGVWADEWIGGALKTAPSIIMGVEAIAGGSTAETQAALQAVVAAQSALGSYHAVVAAGSGDPAEAQANVVAAIEQINLTVGEAKKVIEVVK
jgi:hypothetical protein